MGVMATSYINLSEKSPHVILKFEHMRELLSHLYVLVCQSLRYLILDLSTCLMPPNSFYFPQNPPSTMTVVPLTKLLAGLARYNSAPTKSSASPNLCCGTRSKRYFTCSSSFIYGAVIGLFMNLQLVSVTSTAKLEFGGNRLRLTQGQ